MPETSENTLVYLLIADKDQQDFVDANNDSAEPCSSVAGVYSSLERAEKQKEEYDKYETGGWYYYIETRPLL